MGKMCQSGKHVGAGPHVLQQCSQPLSYNYLQSFCYVIHAIFIEILTHQILKHPPEPLISLTFRRRLFSFYLLCDFRLIIRLVLRCCYWQQPISDGVVVRGEYIGCDECQVFHLRAGALVHGALESKCDEPIPEGLVSAAVLHEHSHLQANFAVDAADAQHLLHAEVLPLEDLTQGESLQLSIFLSRNHKTNNITLPFPSPVLS